MSAPRAVLVGVLVPGRAAEDLAASLDELGRLAESLGFTVVGRLVQRRASADATQLLGRGRLRTLAAWTGGTGEVHRGPPKSGRDEDEGEEEARHYRPEEDDLPEEDDEDPGEEPPPPGAPRATVVVVDHDLSPSQLRNLKAAAGCEVLDRSGVIIEIFSERARSREARLQVEMARLHYLAPRLRELGGPSERQRGGIGGKGAGETGIELDRRRVRDRIAEIRRELAALESNSAVRRERRQGARKVALVGYTNAGKSSLMRALTGAEPYVADQLFATLDTTLRRVHVPGADEIVLSDTVGFIRDLPHDLVAAFRATLAEASEADLIVHVVDASAPDRDAQDDAVGRVLADIGADRVPALRVLNKIDSAGLEPGVERDPCGTIRTVRLSALTGAGCAGFLAALAERFPAGAATSGAAATAGAST